MKALALTVVFSSPAFAADTYVIDKDHSSIGFSVTHLMVSTVRGEFTDYAGTITWDSDPNAILAEATIQATSVDTREPDRDTHLRKAEFFDVTNFPTIKFKTKSVKKEGDNYLLTGDLTIRDVTKEITLPASIKGPVKSPFGKEVIGLSGQVVINRQDFGVSWNKTMDQGGVVVGDIVTLEINIEADKQAPPAPAMEKEEKK